MKSWLAHYKYRGNQRWLHVMSHMLHRIWQKEYANLIDFITYVPVSTQRLQERTFNQAEQLARQLSTINKVPVQPLLHRRLDTAKQSSKSRLERSEMMDDVFECIDDMHDLRLNVQNARILIIDDVYTTGNTMHACARAIRQNWKAKIYGLSWARS
jgi:ComF family protein